MTSQARMLAAGNPSESKIPQLPCKHIKSVRLCLFPGEWRYLSCERKYNPTKEDGLPAGNAFGFPLTDPDLLPISPSKISYRPDALLGDLPMFRGVN